VEPVLQRTHPRFQSLDDLFQRMVLRPQARVLLLEFCVRRSKFSVLSFEFLDPAVQPFGFCSHSPALKM
jgi:hypothetical protein